MSEVPIVRTASQLSAARSVVDVEIKFGTLDETEMERLYQAALNADIAWSRDLRRVYGRRAGDARYDHRGVATAALRELYGQKVTADKIWLAAMRATRKPLRPQRPLAA